MNKTGLLKERTVKLVQKHRDGRPDTLYYAEPGTGVTWTGEAGDPRYYGGRAILWCTLDTGESLGLTYAEVDWNEEET